MSEQNLFNMDCIDGMKKLPDKSIDLVLADPPYGTTHCKWDVTIPFEPMWKELKRVAKTNAAIVLFGNEPFSSALRMSMVQSYKYDWVWVKHHTGQLNAKKQPLRNVENIMVFYSHQCTYNPQFETGNPYVITRIGYKGSSAYGKQRDHTTVNNGERYPKQILTFKEPMKYHPTQKPVALLEYLVRTYTKQGETVLDFTMGSGSTGVACANLGRNFIGIELDADYFNIAEKRINGAVKEAQVEQIIIA